MDLNTLLKVAKENKHIVPKEFIKTDNFHFVKHIEKDKYHTVEIVEFPDGWYYVSSAFVQLSEYIHQEEFAHTYLNINGWQSVGEIEGEYGAHWTNLILACLIEDLSDYKNADIKGFKTEKEVENYLAEIKAPVNINWNV